MCVWWVFRWVIIMLIDLLLVWLDNEIRGVRLEIDS